MKRKIIKQGHNTMTVTLPSEWVKRFNLDAKSEVEVIERDNGLFISTKSSGEIKKTEFDISDMDIPTIWKYFMAVYREGYDELTVRFPRVKQLESPYKHITQHRTDLKYGNKAEKKNIFYALLEFVNRFIGFEIVEHGKDYVIIRDMSDVTGKEFDNALRRIFLLFQGMIDDTIKAIESNNPEHIRDMHDIDINLDKFHDYCIRILNKKCRKDTRQTSLYFTTLYLLELAADEFKNISIHLLTDFKKAKLDSLKEFAELVKNQIMLYTDLFYKFDARKIRELSELDQIHYLKVSDIYKKSNGNENEIFHHLRIISRLLNALLELRIEMEF